jgi:hypothetical protein
MPHFPGEIVQALCLRSTSTLAKERFGVRVRGRRFGQFFVSSQRRDSPPVAFSQSGIANSAPPG